MLIFKLMYLIRGYVVIRVNSINSEKTLNILRRRNIKVWDVEKRDKGIKFKISYEDYIAHLDLISEIMKPVSKKGFMLKLNKIKFRRGFRVYG